MKREYIVKLREEVDRHTDINLAKKEVSLVFDRGTAFGLNELLDLYNEVKPKPEKNIFPIEK